MNDSDLYSISYMPSRLSTRVQVKELEMFVSQFLVDNNTGCIAPLTVMSSTVSSKNQLNENVQIFLY